MRSHGRRPFLSHAFLIALPFLLVSCSSWQTIHPAELTARDKHYTQMRVWLVDGEVSYLRDPWFSGDTLHGGGEAIPIERIVKVEAWRTSVPKTALAVVGVGLAAVVAVSAIACASGPCFGLGDNCPRIYSWDGTAWRLDSGTYAGAIMPALARTDVDNLDFAQDQEGILRLRITGAPGETEHVDAIRLLLVDHDPQCTIAPDGGGALHALGPLSQPTAARDFRRRDILKLVRANDALNWESVPTGRDTLRADDIRDGLEIEFPRVAGATEARLVVDGRYTLWKNYLMGEYIQLHGRDTGAWYRALSTDTTQAHGFAEAIARETFLHVSVWDGVSWRGQGLLPGVGPELPKRQVVRLDLSGVRGTTVRVRLEAAPSLWLIDRVAIDLGPERGFVAKEVGLSDARDSQGRDVRALLDRGDGQVQVMESSDSLELRFAVDPVPPGRARSYLAATTGWYHLHTSESGDPDWALADHLIQEPGAMSRFSVGLLNEALQSMAAAGH